MGLFDAPNIPAPAKLPPPPDVTDTAVRGAQDARRRKALATMGRMQSYLRGPTTVSQNPVAPKATLGA
jgi:hypothetical protein